MGKQYRLQIGKLAKVALAKKQREDKRMQNLTDSQIERLASAQNQDEHDVVMAGAEFVPAMSKSAAIQQRDDWAAAAQYYWAKAYMAMTQRDYRLMRVVADQAQGADKAASLDGAVLGAIFGVAPACADTQAIAQGRGLPKADVAAARKAVLAEVAKHAADQAAAKATQRAVENATYAAEKAERAKEKQAAAEGAGLVIGAEVHVHWTYKQARLGVATTAAGQKVECWGRLPFAGAGEGVAIVKKIGGRLPVVELKD